jgi:ComF family protein
MLRALIQRASQALPSQCAVCRTWPTAQPVCEACVADFAQPEPRCQTCALPVSGGVARCGDCVLHPPPLDTCLTAVGYGFPWQDLVADFKFRDAPGWADLFALLLQSTHGVDVALAQADGVLPVPLSTARLRQRGFNQALLLAQALEPAKTRAHLLLRIKDTPPQSLLDRAARLNDVKDAFAVDPLLVTQVRGQSIVLVDDVMTTGATLHGAALALRAAGATRVTALVFARTDRE